MHTRSKSSTTIARVSKEWVRFNLPTHRAPTHAGEMLLEEFLKPLGMTQSAFAIRLGVSFPRLNELINGKRSVTADTALRLSRVLGTTANFWLNMQAAWDLWHALQGTNGRRILALRPIRKSEWPAPSDDF